MPRSGMPPAHRWFPYAALLILPLLIFGCSNSRIDADEEVWIIGLDGGDWDMLEPLIERGDMPNLASLRDGGAWGVLRSDEPMLSPVLWTSIATGRTPDVHGVTWFMTDAPDGGKAPVGTYDRHAHAVWNVAVEAGLSAGVVGWWASWPAEHLDGFVVSDYVGWHSFGVTGRATAAAGETWPEEIGADVRSAMPDPDDIPVDLLQRMVHLPRARLAAGAGAGAYADDLRHLRQAVATTRGYTDIVKERLEADRPDLLCLYYEGTDAVMHLFGDAAAPHQPWISDGDFEAYRDVVDEYWIWQDELLGELLALRGPNTTVVVVSDHGFRVGAERRKEDRFNIETADADHMIDGIVVVNGPATPAGSRIRGAEIYDVAPTVLHALGLPIADDLSGIVLVDAFDGGFLESRPIDRVATYENRPLHRPPMPDRRDGAGENMERMLESLGYIAGRSDAGAGSGPVDEAGHTVEQGINLATILMKQGRLDEAVEELEGVLAVRPEHPEARLNLAQALARTGDAARAEALYRGLIADDPDDMAAREDLALCLGRDGRPADALAAYEAGLDRNPDWVEGLSGKGHALFLTGRPAEAAAALNRALEIDPRNHGALYYLGLLQIDGGDVAAAAATLQRAHELEPADEPTALRLAAVHERAGRMGAALAVLRGVRDSGGDSPDLEAELGATLLRAGEAKEALPHLHAAAEARGDDAGVQGNLGLAHAMTGDLRAAAAAFERVVALEPESPDSHTQLGMFYAQLGSAAEAEREFRAAVRYDRDDPVAHLHLAMLMHQTGRIDEARTVYEQTIGLAPDLAVAWYNLGMLEGASGHRDEAARCFAQARELDPSLPPPGGGRGGGGRAAP